VHRFVVGDLFAADEQEVVVRIGIEQRRVRERVVVGDDQKLIAVSLVPGENVVRRRVAVGVDGGVCILPRYQRGAGACASGANVSTASASTIMEIMEIVRFTGLSLATEGHRKTQNGSEDTRNI
jgi:hypothetical protein